MVEARRECYRWKLFLRAENIIPSDHWCFLGRAEGRCAWASQGRVIKELFNIVFQ